MPGARAAQPEYAWVRERRRSQRLPALRALAAGLPPRGAQRHAPRPRRADRGRRRRLRRLPRRRLAAAARPAALRLPPLVLNRLVDGVTHLIGHHGVPAVFFLMILESACLPVPSEVIMLFAGYLVSI